jgi:hypothetical protein
MNKNLIDKVYQLLARGRWFSPASFTTKTGRHDIADILLKVELKHQKSNQIKSGREPPTTGKQLVNFITCGCESSAPFLAHLAKGNVSFCHHLAAIVRVLKTFIDI